MSHLEGVWVAWVNAEGGNKERRKLLVQIINCLCLSYRWESYERAIEAFCFVSSPPQVLGLDNTLKNSELLQEAVVIAVKYNWDRKSIRKYL